MYTSTGIVNLVGEIAMAGTPDTLGIEPKINFSLWRVIRRGNSVKRQIHRLLCRYALF